MNVSSSQSGEYRCTAANELGSCTTSARLTVTAGMIDCCICCWLSMLCVIAKLPLTLPRTWNMLVCTSVRLTHHWTPDVGHCFLYADLWLSMTNYVTILGIVAHPIPANVLAQLIVPWGRLLYDNVVSRNSIYFLFLLMILYSRGCDDNGCWAVLMCHRNTDYWL